MYRIVACLAVVLTGCLLETKDLCPDDWPSGDSELDHACRTRMCREEGERYEEQCSELQRELNAADGGPGVDGSGGGPVGADDAGGLRDDAAIDASGSPCDNVACSADAPVCVEGDCQSCRSDDDCVGYSDMSVCDADTGACVECTPFDERVCTERGQVCERGGRSCVGCNENADCSDSGAPRCDIDLRECVGCQVNADCATAFGDVGQRLPVCNEAGACVECTGLDYLTCSLDEKGNQRVCSSLSQTCSTQTEATVGVCGECDSDASCLQGQRCVLQEFFGEEVGYFCIWELGLPHGQSACGLARPYIRRLRNASSIDGFLSDFCTLETGTCKANDQFRSPQDGCVDVSPESDTACGEPGLDDALCRLFDGTSPRCTVECNSSDNCRPGFACNIRATPSYCVLELDRCWLESDCPDGHYCARDNTCKLGEPPTE